MQSVGRSIAVTVRGSDPQPNASTPGPGSPFVLRRLGLTATIRDPSAPSKYSHERINVISFGPLFALLFSLSCRSKLGD